MINESDKLVIEKDGKALNLNALLCIGTIDRIENKSDCFMSRVIIYFKNKHELSIVRGLHSYGGDKGLFEIMASNSSVYDEDVIGFLSIDRVQYYINKIGNL